MTRYVAFLRGVSPMNARMTELKRCFEAAGFTNVTTVLSSGNIIFDAPPTQEAALETCAEAAMQRELGRRFSAIIRPVSHLEDILATDPYAAFGVSPEAKRVVSFLRTPAALRTDLPLEAGGARVLCLNGREAFTAYLPGEKSPVFMALIEKAFGKDVTTRTWETVRRCAAA